MNINDTLTKAKNTHTLSKDEIVALLNDKSAQLFTAADEVRKKYKGDGVHLRGLIEFSNICTQNCLYCGLRKDNKNIQRYRLTEREIIEFAQNGHKLGYKTIVLQSGQDPYFTKERLERIIKQIKQNPIAITLSIGELSTDEYKTLKRAGADRFLLRIETTDRELYQSVSPDMSWEHRKKCLNDIRDTGYELGSGCLVGLPNQTIESLADDILFFKEIDADMIGIGPFIPNPDTPLKDAKAGDFDLTLRVMSIVRLILPDINIPATTAMETINPDGRIIALKSGANVVMPNITQGQYRELYALYPGKICTGDTPEHCRGCITKKINNIGRYIAEDYGFRKPI